MKKSISSLFLTAIFMLGLFVNQVFAQTEITSGTVYTSGSSFSVPSGYKVVKVEVWGGGGGGERNSTQCGDGGGGGGYACINLDGSLVGPVTFDVTIGGGGSAASGENSLGCPGGTTTVSYSGTWMVQATGGRGGGHTGTYSCGGDASYYGRAGGTGSVNTAFPGYSSQVANNGGSGGSGESWGLGDFALRAGGGGGAAGSSSGTGASGSDGHANAVNATGGNGGTGANGAGSGGVGGDNGFSDHNGGNGTAPGGGGGGCPNKGLTSAAHPGNGAVGGVRFTLQATCNVSPGAIASETWICNPGTPADTSIVISSTTDASSSTPGNYLWQSSSDNSSWTTISNTNAKQYTVTATGYYRRGYAVDGCSTVYTDPVYVTRPSDIDPGTLKDGDEKIEKVICSGDPVNITLSKTYSGNVDWQTSTDGSNWSTVATANTYTIDMTSVTTTTYVRYIVNYTASCGIPSNNIYTITVNALPVVNSITAPTNLCPGQSSYDLNANITSSADISTYTWTGVTSNTGASAQIVPSGYQCGQLYSYSLKVTDENGCESEEVSGNFTTTTPALTIGTIANLTAFSDGACGFSIPTEEALTAAVNAALTSSCGNTVSLSNISPAAESPITGPAAVTATVTDMCGNTLTQPVTINIVIPTAPSAVTITADDVYLCPGETTTLTVDVTAEEPTYTWDPSSLGTAATATTIAYTAEDVVAHADNYSVVVTDKYGCPSSGNIDIFTTPKAYVADKEYTICADREATMLLATADKVPTGNSTIDLLTFTYTTTYTWTIASNTGVGGATAGTDQANFTTGVLTNTTLQTQTVVYTVTPTTVTTVGGAEVNSCTGASFTVTVNVKPKVTNDGAITNFDDADVIITLWYGACDTLYYVETPTYDNNILPADLAVYLTNDKGGNVNAGTLLGRIAPGEYTIVWTLTDECGNYVTYTKKYIVRYPNCGDNDPNYTDPFYAEDANGILYHTVRIGCECWTAENLRSTKYSDDTDIPSSNVYHSDDYPNDAENEAKFGRLYSWYSAMHVTEGDDTAEPSTSNSPVGRYVQGVCPAGWAVPTVGIYTSMKNISGAIENVKSSDQTTWLPGLAGIAPGSGFNAKGAGYYESYIDRYMNLLGQTDFWTSTIGPTVQKGTCVEITHVCPEMLIKDYMKGLGFSVRCVKRDEIDPSSEPETFNCGTTPVRDHEGHEYRTVQIGDQCWMAENLRTTTSPNSRNFLQAGSADSFTQAYYYDNTNTATNYNIPLEARGLYYNWAAVVDTVFESDEASNVVFTGNRRGICPEGWHLPSYDEWTMLENYVGANYACGGNSDNNAKALATDNASYWNMDEASESYPCYPDYNPNTTNNATGFSAVPAGYYAAGSYYLDAGNSAIFWSSNQLIYYPNHAYAHGLTYDSAVASPYSIYNHCGFSVRCLKD